MGNLEVSETKLINENQAKMDYYPELPLSARDSDNTETSTQVSRNTSKKRTFQFPKRSKSLPKRRTHLALFKNTIVNTKTKT